MARDGGGAPYTIAKAPPGDDALSSPPEFHRDPQLKHASLPAPLDIEPPHKPPREGMKWVAVTHPPPRKVSVSIPNSAAAAITIFETLRPTAPERPVWANVSGREAVTSFTPQPIRRPSPRHAAPLCHLLVRVYPDAPNALGLRILPRATVIAGPKITNGKP